MAATSAFAQNAVSLYGALDFGYSNAKYEKNDTLQVIRKGFATSSNDTSRWGLTGTEDLGSGLKAEFKIESNIGTNPRSGILNDVTTRNGLPAGNGYTLDATVLGDRELWAAIVYDKTRVQGGFGVTALRNLAVQTSADASNNMGNPINHEFGAYRREGVQVSQTFAPGFVATAAVTGNRQQNGVNAVDTYKVGRGYNAALTYAQGPINAGIAYDEVSTQNPAITDVPVGSPASALAAANATLKSTLIAGSYDFGAAKAFAQYYHVNNVIGALGAVSEAQQAAGEGKKKALSLGVQVPFGAVVPFAQIFKGTNSQAATTDKAEDRNWTGYTLGARYNMSKRTYAYAATGQYKTASGSLTSLDSAAHFGDKAVFKQSSVGLVHNF